MADARMTRESCNHFIFAYHVQIITCINVLFLFQTIAARLLQSKQTIPHYYLTIDVIVDELLK